MEESIVVLNTIPIINNNLDNIKNIVLIDNTINSSELFFNSNNSNTLTIKYNYYTDGQKMTDCLINKFKCIQRLCFVFDNSMMNHKIFLNNEPFFNENDISQFDNNNIILDDYSNNVKLLINIINSLKIKHVDFLVCNSLQYINWTKYYQLLQTFTSAIIGASNDLTGNIKYGGNWLMENTNENIQNIYFNDNIINYSLTLINNNIKYLQYQTYGRIFFKTIIKNASLDKTVTLNKFTDLYYYINNNSNYKVYYRKKNETNYIFVNDNNAFNIIINPREVYEILCLFQNSGFAYAITTYDTLLVTDNILSIYSGSGGYYPSGYSYDTIPLSIADSTLENDSVNKQRSLAFGLDYSYDFLNPRPTIAQLKALGYSDNEIRLSGYTIIEFKTAGYTDVQIKGMGFTIIEFRTSGYTDTQIKGLGFTASEFRTSGYTIIQLKGLGFTDSQLKVGGFTITEFRTSGYTVTQLKAIGFTDSEIRLVYLINEVNNDIYMFDNTKAINLFSNLNSTGSFNIDVNNKNYNYYDYLDNSYKKCSTIYINTLGCLSFKNSVNDSSWGTNKQYPFNSIKFYSGDFNTTAKYYFDNDNNCMISYIGGYYYDKNELSFDIIIKITPLGVVYVYYKNIGKYLGTTYFGKPVIGFTGNSNLLNNDDTYYPAFDGIQPFNENNINGKTLAFNLSDSIIFSNICFAFGTPIATDQGNIQIQNINTDYHTINGKKIVYVTKTLSMDKHLICFEKNSLGNDIPNNKTITSRFHGIYINDKLVRANDLVNNENIYKIKYDEEILYNILMENHEKILVNNMICETLHPTNYVAQLYKVMEKLDNLERETLIKEVNKLVIKNKSFASKLKIVLN